MKKLICLFVIIFCISICFAQIHMSIDQLCLGSFRLVNDLRYVNIINISHNSCLVQYIITFYANGIIRGTSICQLYYSCGEVYLRYIQYNGYVNNLQALIVSRNVYNVITAIDWYSPFGNEILCWRRN